MVTRWTDAVSQTRSGRRVTRQPGPRCAVDCAAWSVSRGQARAPVLAAWALWVPSANSSTILAQKAGRSSGLRLETMPESLTHSSSTQFAPALRRSVFRLGHEVMVLP